MHARLIEDDMRESGDSPSSTSWIRSRAKMAARLASLRLPERRLVDPVGFAFDALAEAERLEHFHRAAGDAVGLAELQRARLLLDDAGLDVGKGGELRGERQAGRPAADDQHIDLCGQRVGARARRGASERRRCRDRRGGIR